MDDLMINEYLSLPAGDLEWVAVRASGHGGQNVNKVSSKVELRFLVSQTQVLSDPVKERLCHRNKGRLDGGGNLIITSQKTRDQHRNLEDACEKLRELILQALETPKLRRPTKPTYGSHQQRMAKKRLTGEKKINRRKRVEEE